MTSHLVRSSNVISNDVMSLVKYYTVTKRPCCALSGYWHDYGVILARVRSTSANISIGVPMTTQGTARPFSDLFIAYRIA